jgi:hypothetical protein
MTIEKWHGRGYQPKWSIVDGIAMRDDGVSSIERKRKCQKCGQQLAGKGNVLCGECKERIEGTCGLSE